MPGIHLDSNFLNITYTSTGINSLLTVDDLRAMYNKIIVLGSISRPDYPPSTPKLPSYYFGKDWLDKRINEICRKGRL